MVIYPTLRYERNAEYQQPMNVRFENYRLMILYDISY